MSFRIRVFLLVAVVAFGATATTAFFTLRQAGDQVRDAATASWDTIDLMRGQLRAYAWNNGTWEGVADLVRMLHDQTGQRLRLVDAGGAVIVDTDHLAGLASRPPGPDAVFIDPLPALTLAPGDRDPHATTLAAIERYRSETARAACLTRLGWPQTAVAGPDGVPRHSTLDELDGPTSERCRPGPTPAYMREEDAVEAARCTEDDPEPVEACLEWVFRRQITVDQIAPVPLLLVVGAADEPVTVLRAGPLLTTAGVVAALVTAGALLISRRVLRPIGTLTTAARRLGRGDRAGRVPDDGRDELAELARAFNQMTDSVKAAEDNQRRLIADVAHELRTPLANLRGYLEAMQDGVFEPTPELFASLHDEVILYQRIVDDLQELALAEAGALVYHRMPTDLAELMETARTAHAAAAEAVGVRLVVDTDGPVVAEADADRIRQAVGNLVGNALRATPAGGSIFLYARRADDHAVLRVTDTGEGIAPEHLPLVFDRLWRADPARGRDSGGSGLGLAIVRQIVRDHDGEVSVRSRLGEGTTVEVTLPLPATSDLSSGASGRSTKRCTDQAAASSTATAPDSSTQAGRPV